MRALLTGAGFRVDALTYWNTSLFPVMACWRPISRIFTSAQSPRSDLKPLPRFVNQVLSTLVVVEAGVGSRLGLPFGSSIFAVATKPRRDEA